MPRESIAQRKRRTQAITAALKKQYPDARCSLDHADPLELLVATILAAQCTDERVNIVTKDLFGKYRTAGDYAAADLKTLEEEIRTTGFYHNKAKSIRAAAGKLVEDFGGQVPQTMAELLTLPGVARKTANVVLGTAFGRNEGVVVDTHVTRLAQRLKLTGWPKARPDKIEQDLMPLVPREDWTIFAHLLVFHGRACCTARKPDCAHCVIREHCPSAFQVKGDGKGKSSG